ncbi:MAG: universal stress protein [Chloroflexi bacterium]|nr:universal stress protein [Chloroflexota bacterium]
MAERLKTALVPVTGNPLDGEAVALACDLVKPSKGRVWVLYVIEVPRRLPLDAEIASRSAEGERVLQQMEQIGKRHKCKVEGEIVQARALGVAVVDEAVQRSADLIVAGASYEEHFGVPTLGELVPYLLKHSPCRVIVYRDAQPAGGGN